MTQKILGWVGGVLIMGVFSMFIFPDLLRGYVDVSAAQAEQSSGERVYTTYCIGCHGETGEGNGLASEFLNPKPRNFVNGNFKYFHFGEAGPFPTDASMVVTIRNGLPGTAMPAFNLLSDQETNDVIAYVQSLRAGGWENTDVQAEAPPIEGTTGEELFQNAGCIACHKLDAVGSIGGVGPNLSAVGSRRSIEEIKMSIQDPNAVIAEDCPAGPCPENVMPRNFAERFTDEQLDTLATFLSEQK